MRNIAKRCQLITGSFEANKNKCPCAAPGDCLLSEQERVVLREHPEVVASAIKNLKEFSGDSTH